MTLIRFSFRWIWLRIAIEVHLPLFAGAISWTKPSAELAKPQLKLNIALKASEW
ncbi:MAG: hypothetical protein ACTS47_00715 [Candidatus Hodgkinia cicadicola]